jgi:hypothetical protein
LLGKGPKKLYAHLEPNAAIPIDSDLTTGLRLLRADFVPDQTTTLWHDAREFGRFRLAADDSERDAIELLELNSGRRHGLSFYKAGVGPFRFF